MGDAKSKHPAKNGKKGNKAEPEARPEEETKNKGGQPTKYTEESPTIAEELCRVKGYRDKDLAKHFGVCEETINEWKRRYSEFSVSIKKGKDVFDTVEVEAALHKRAKGYSYTEVTEERVPGKKGEEPQLTVVKRVKKHQPSSDVSMIFWLKNRNPDRWSDKKEIDHRIAATETLTDEELEERIRAIKAAGNGLDTKSIEGPNG